MIKWIVVMKVQPCILLDNWGKPWKTPVRLVGTRIWTRDLPSTSIGLIQYVLSFRARQYQRSLAPVMNDFDDYDVQWYPEIDVA